MAGRLSQAIIEEVQRANDIVEVISSYLPLKRSGKDYKACCPFHAEKTPSFFVSPSKQIFKCFGCGKGGSVFQFVMARENVLFPEAVRLLAERAGIRIQEAPRSEAAEGGLDRSRVFKAVAWALQTFEKFLHDPEEGRRGREYLERRGFTEETVSKFRLGWAPDSWDALARAAARRRVADELLVAAGLVVPRSEGGGFYDRFRNRVIFPIFDTLNRPIAFGGRTLGDDPAKYLNSPDTAVFNKSHNLYGLVAAREAMTESRRVIVVEGYTDCLMAHQAGLGNVVATLGTSLTRDHVRLLRRYVDEVLLVFDGDLAGQNAADRAVQIFLEEELSVKIVTLPENLDPCDFLAQGRKDEFLQLVAAAPDALEYKWRLVRHQFEEADSVRGRRRAVEALLEAVAAQPVWVRTGDNLKRDLVLARMSAVLGVEEQSLRARLRELVRAARGRPQSEAPGGAEAERKPAGVAGAQDLQGRAERLVLKVLLALPGKIAVVRERLPPRDIKDDVHRRLYEKLLENQERLADEGVSALWSRLDDEALAALAADLASASDVGEKADLLLEDARGVLKRLSERDEVAALRDKLGSSRSDEERRAALQRLQELRQGGGGGFLPPGTRPRK